MGDVAAALTWPLTRPPIQSRGRMYVPSARIGRCLFGPVDHEQMKSTLQEYQKDLLEKSKHQWNFDFENDRPIPGRYKWEELKEGEDPSDADSNGGSAAEEEEKKPAKLEQTKITDFMRKRKSSNHKDDSSSQPPKTRRRSST